MIRGTVTHLLVLLAGLLLGIYVGYRAGFCDGFDVMHADPDAIYISGNYR